MQNEKPHITIPNSTPSEELYRFGADGNMRLYMSHRLPPRPNDFWKKIDARWAEQCRKHKSAAPIVTT
ncbi:MAG: hypothetical protein IJP95_04340 [Bacteroidales bacterium]|nr:hypothetical protein [Bacteroidales bacterium]